MISFFRTYQHLLPSARAWRLTTGKTLRALFEGLSTFPADAHSFVDKVWLDNFPDTTRELSEWELQFGLASTGLSEQERRERLTATWRALGGQSPAYIQETLQAAGFDVWVHEWWVPSVEHPTGGAVDGDVTPVARNPFAYLWDGVSPRQFVGCGHDLAACGADLMFVNSQSSPPGYPLVNKVLEASSSTIGVGHSLAFCGGLTTAAGAVTVGSGQKQYAIPADPTKYPFFLYIGGNTFPETASVPAARKDEFEALCLKICPLEQWLGILITYT